MKSLRHILFLIAMGMWLLTACNGQTTTSTEARNGLPAITATALPPAATPVPLAALVNGESILLEHYQAELARFEDAQTEIGIDLASLEQYQLTVIEAMIARQLLAKAAIAAGIDITDELLQIELTSVKSNFADDTAYQTWLETNHYDSTTFPFSLLQEMLASGMIERITSDMPTSAVHIHARHLLVADAALAENLHNQLLAGEDFATVASAYSLDISTRPAGGDLGWFSVGSLSDPALETEIFTLETGTLSEVLKSDFGYHLVEVIDRTERSLSANAVLRQKQILVEKWLIEARTSAQIKIYINP